MQSFVPANAAVWFEIPVTDMGRAQDGNSFGLFV